MNEEIKLILKSNQLIMRDRMWNSQNLRDKSNVIDEQITELLNPESETSIQDKTKSALSDASYTENEVNK